MRSRATPPTMMPIRAPVGSGVDEVDFACVLLLPVVEVGDDDVPCIEEAPVAVELEPVVVKTERGMRGVFVGVKTAVGEARLSRVVLFSDRLV